MTLQQAPVSFKEPVAVKSMMDDHEPVNLCRGINPILAMFNQSFYETVGDEMPVIHFIETDAFHILKFEQISMHT